MSNGKIEQIRHSCSYQLVGSFQLSSSRVRYCLFDDRTESFSVLA